MPPGSVEEEHVAGGNVCPHCGRTFASPSGLSIHIGRTHSGKPAPVEQSYPCNLCDETFARPQALGAHKRYSHPAKPKAVAVVEPERPKLAQQAGPIERRPFDPQAARESAASTIYLDEAG